MLTRIAAGVVGLAILLPALFLGGVLAVEIIVTLALLVGLDEYARMAAPDRNWRALALLVLGGGGIYAATLWGTPTSLVGSLAGASLIVLLGALFGVKETTESADFAVRLLGGILWVPLFIAFLVLLRRLDHGLAWIFVVLGAAWMGDTGAYFAGRTLGRHKLFERVSPKKTWEGFFGGLVASVAWTCFVKVVALPDLPWVHVIILGALLDTMGVLGDLVESMFKRSYGVKDSGWILPGHGGILDRIDSVLLIAPVTWLYITAFGLG